MKISFSLRAFVLFFVLLGSLTWLFLDKATEKMRVAFQQSSETVLVDTAVLLATSLEQQFKNQVLDTDEISQLFEKSYQRKIKAQIYSLYKDEIDLEIYITNRQGIVVYDSTGLHEGKDFSRWRDVKLTLQGEYGARSSYRFEGKSNPGDERVMVVAAPIEIEETIVGAVSVVKPIKPLEQLFASESAHLKTYILIFLAVATLIAYLISHSFTLSISRLVNYANKMARAERSQQPAFMDKRFDNLASAITQLRDKLDGKEYVEHYIHGLTHELKTPLTSVAAAELLSTEMPASEQKRFIGNIKNANNRMQRLVERMLDLTKLENLDTLAVISECHLHSLIQEQLEQNQASIKAQRLSIDADVSDAIQVHGDPLLLQQAIGNLLDNAIENSPTGADIHIRYNNTGTAHHLKIINPGQLDDFILQRAFERFFSVPAQNGSRKSTGLGLSFVNEIMKLHQGGVRLSNTEQGICAEIHWPLNLQSISSTEK